jgi:hypothetical protein
MSATRDPASGSRCTPRCPSGSGTVGERPGGVRARGARGDGAGGRDGHVSHATLPQRLLGAGGAHPAIGGDQRRGSGEERHMGLRHSQRLPGRGNRTRRLGFPCRSGICPPPGWCDRQDRPPGAPANHAHRRCAQRVLHVSIPTLSLASLVPPGHPEGASGSLHARLHRRRPYPSPAEPEAGSVLPTAHAGLPPSPHQASWRWWT